MAAPNQSALAAAVQPQKVAALVQVAGFSGLRVLAWQGSVLYASRGYTLLRTEVLSGVPRLMDWQVVGGFLPPSWRRVTSSLRWTARLCRDGFHALGVLSSGSLVAAVPGAIVTQKLGEKSFTISHRVKRGTRPLHLTPTPDGRVFWGEYFDNPRREEVHIFGSRDQGSSWQIVYTFSRGEIRHVHNIIYDKWEECLWILTGDYGPECRILRASLDFRDVEPVIAGNQHARAVAILPTRNALYFSSDTPLEPNHVFRLDRSGSLTSVADLSSSSIYGCKIDDKMFFSTMAEPSTANTEREVRLYAGGEDCDWKPVLSWTKDRLPMRYFQYGNGILPDGDNTSGLLAITTIAIEKGDLETTLWSLDGTKTADN
jgi:hypothetical protein